MNNKILVSWAVLILDEKASIDDVPTKLQSGVQEVMDYFTQAVTEAPKETADSTEPATKPAKVPVTESTDQVVADANDAVKEATKEA